MPTVTKMENPLGVGVKHFLLHNVASGWNTEKHNSRKYFPTDETPMAQGTMGCPHIKIYGTSLKIVFKEPTWRHSGSLKQGTWHFHITYLPSL